MSRNAAVDVQASSIRVEPQENTGRSCLWYNFNDGGLESMVQGYRSALLRHEDYNALCQCETLNDVKMYLQANTSYGEPPFLQDVAELSASIIKEKAQEKLVREFNELREWSDAPLSTFLDFISYDYMVCSFSKGLLLLFSLCFFPFLPTSFLVSCRRGGGGGERKLGEITVVRRRRPLQSVQCIEKTEGGGGAGGGKGTKKKRAVRGDTVAHTSKITPPPNLPHRSPTS